MTFGPFLFGAPLALLGLIALPLIWWILRATPPAPKAAELPSMRLLDGIDPREETPARTPWWVLLLRMLAAALAIAGLSLPVWSPGATPDGEAKGALLVVIDDGWTSTPRWNELTRAARGAVDSAGRDAAVYMLQTAPRSLHADPAGRLTPQDAERRLASISPSPWAVNRADALKRLEASGVKPSQILWATDGLDPESGDTFAAALAVLAPLSVYAAPPQGPAALTGISADANAATVTLRRAGGGKPESVYVSAMTLDGSALATSEAIFAQGEKDAAATFDLPAAALARIARFQVAGRQGAGTVWLWDSTARSRRVGLVTGGTVAQPLLSDMHYIRKALEPFATISEGTLEDLIAESPDAIFLTDVGEMSADRIELVQQWVEKGGALIRFAGPRLAVQGDSLVPTPLRRASRALGGSLAWDEPQKIDAFPATSPFAGLTPPKDAVVRQQVLAQPAADLQSKTWARLVDGSPLVTADQRGNGAVILFHVTAGPDWSDLPYSGTYVEMLRRAIAAGRGEAMTDTEGSYSPQLVLDAYGRLSAPASTAAPLAASAFAGAVPSEINPPGLYQGPAGTRALNVAAGYRPSLIERWPASARLLGDAEARTMKLAGPLLGLAALLIALDLFVALGVAGRLPRIGRRHATKVAAVLLAAGLAAYLLPAQKASAQYNDPYAPAYSTRFDPYAGLPPIERKLQEAALELRFGYVQTGDAQLDKTTMAGLQGLSNVLYQRSSVEPATPHALNLETDALELYPLIYYAVPDTAAPLSDKAVANLNAYLRVGGALLIDTRKGSIVGSQSDVSGLEDLLKGLDAPPLAPVPKGHVLSKSFYLLDDFPGRYENRRLWIEATASSDEPRGDGVSRLFIGDADWAAAWAVDDRGRSLFSVDGGETQREMARRFGVNLAMYILTGNYKSDQVHIPALLERLGQDPNAPREGDIDINSLPDLQDGGPR